MINLLNITEIIFFAFFTEIENSHKNCYEMHHLTKTIGNRVVISFSLDEKQT